MKRHNHLPGPGGGLRAHARALRRWRWDGHRRRLSEPVRCKREQWYLARGRLAQVGSARGATLPVRFILDDESIREQSIDFHALAEAGPPDELLGWVQAPERATHFQLALPAAADARLFDEIVFHPIAERDPKCHPLANTPRWSAYRPPFPIERVVLPAALQPLAECVTHAEVEWLANPRSKRQLAARTQGAACVLEPEWVRRLNLTLIDVERLAATRWLILDLQTLATLAERAGVATTRVVSHAARHEIMSARVDYADVPTRGLALQDVVPYATLDDRGDFCLRVLHAGRAWKRYANEVGFATLLASETPWEHRCGDVVSAARPVERGELLATDLPWLVAGRHGPLLAPRVARHLLRMHLAAPLGDHVQYWNRWGDDRVLVRDIAAFPRRYPPLRTARWASSDPALAHLGITLPPGEKRGPARHLTIRTGRIDRRAPAGGLPPEPMMIYMKWLAREAAERTPWATRHLAQLRVTWQFDSAAGLRYAVDYASAAEFSGNGRDTVVHVRPAAAGRSGSRRACGGDEPAEIILRQDAGVFGDGSLALQDELTRRLCRLIERSRR